MAKKTQNGMKPGRMIIFGAVALLVVYSFGSGLLRIGRLLMIRHETGARLEAVRDEKQALEIEIERLTGDSLYIEELARREYGMVRNGEEVFHLTLPDSGDGD